MSRAKASKGMKLDYVDQPETEYPKGIQYTGTESSRLNIANFLNDEGEDYREIFYNYNEEYFEVDNAIVLSGSWIVLTKEKDEEGFIVLTEEQFKSRFKIREKKK